ncbi:TPA: hypothetical protein GRI96_24815 [Vibrio parahaemolyticus]|uniref:restriction endonuclease n=1 Tax=Vibrio TaxID=662 RepID=UPI00069F2520|nr:MULTISPECIES: restriction endonuclease [Vibrio]EGR1985738.1 hypothetical protein [Vibrio parahaemolyticus]EII3443184.1 restriction endonuclease [Vibrio parahaemolyticus]ELA7843085.1 restriction endonuclease [Vibrio parahaemolyticus]OXD26693.1 hypothetical protein CA164_23440 [Vibrio parahaemolyticus]HAS6809277.1 hypothetical protein [Vibrio parahaemolyticus]
MENFLGIVPVESIEQGFVGRNKELEKLGSYLSSDPIVLLQGSGGVGKTSLSYKYALENKDRYENGIHRYYAFNRTSSIMELLSGDTLKSESLVVIDEFDLASDSLAKEVIEASKKGTKFLIISRSDLPVFSQYRKIVLDGLSQLDLEEYIAVRKVMGLPIEDISALFHWSGGHPLAMDLALNAIQHRRLSLQDVTSLLSKFDATGIVDSNGRPLRSNESAPPQIIKSVRYVNDEMLERIYSDPLKMHSLSPRQFEELTAELLYRQGYEVELTPASGDGGVDIYAAKKDGVGKFLYLVECKKYSPRNKVGVNIVRSLHGVVQHKRANAGLVVTTSTFTKGAREFQSDIKYQLQLADYMALHEWIDKVAKST